MAAKHTPGPWVSFDRETVSRVYSVGNDGSCLADVHSYTNDAVGPRPNRAARCANARLIAAAPDLLSDGWALALMALQSKRYGYDAAFRDAADAMLDTCRVARGEPTREQHLAAKAKARQEAELAAMIAARKGA